MKSRIKKLKRVEIERELEKHITEFRKAFKKQLSTFITGAFAFVAALLWRDAIKSILDKYMRYIQLFSPLKEEWAIKVFTAFGVTIVAVTAIVIISKVLKE